MAFEDRHGGYTRKDLAEEINEIIQARLIDNGPVLLAWVIQQVLLNHEESGLSDFSKCARYELVNDEAGRCIRRFKDPTPDELVQMVMPGFKRLQKAYRIERDGTTMIVPIDQMSDEELLLKAQEHDVMAQGHRKHARELRRYVRARQIARAA